ncbi:MAG: tetratricopeptide repeat protein [Bacteroidota bacterium]
MKLAYIAYISLFLCTAATSSSAQETMDTTELSKAGKRAKADEYYFEGLKAKAKKDEDRAIHLFEQYTAVEPVISGAYFELAKLYFLQKKMDKSQAAIKKALELDPNNKWYKEEYAAILAESGKLSEAADVIAALANKETREQSYPIMAAEYYERAHKYNEAITYIDKAIARSSSDEDILLRKKVQLYLNLNDVEKAAGVVQQMIAREPKNGFNYKFLGSLYDNNKLPAKAEEVYVKAQKLLPDDPSVQMGLAEHYLKSGDTVKYKGFVKKAIVNPTLDADDQVDLLRAYVQSFPDEKTSITEGMPIIKELVAQHPDDAAILGFYGDFLEGSGQHDSAIVFFKRSVLLKSSDFDAWMKLLSNYTERRDADSMIKYSEKAMRLFPSQARVHFFNSVGHYNKKAYPQAIKAMNRAIDMQPENNRPLLAAMYSQLGDIYHASKQDQLSDEAFHKALAMEPNDPTVLNNYSYYLSVRGVKLDSAEKMSKKSLELRPNEGTFLDTYGWILYKQGKYEKAREYIQKAIDQAGPRADGTLYEHLGDIYYKLKDTQKAVQHWKTAKEKGEDDPQLEKKITEGKLYE